jgi:hypothetical protein
VRLAAVTDGRGQGGGSGRYGLGLMPAASQVEGRLEIAGGSDGRRLTTLLTRMFSTVVVPSARAASSRMRLDSDLEPGSLTWPSITRTGWMVSSWRAAGAAAARTAAAARLPLLLHTRRWAAAASGRTARAGWAAAQALGATHTRCRCMPLAAGAAWASRCAWTIAMAAGAAATAQRRGNARAQCQGYSHVMAAWSTFVRLSRRKFQLRWP